MLFLWHRFTKNPFGIFERGIKRARTSHLKYLVLQCKTIISCYPILTLGYYSLLTVLGILGLAVAPELRVCWGCSSTWRRYLLCVCQETLKVQSFSLAQTRLSSARQTRTTACHRKEWGMDEAV